MNAARPDAEPGPLISVVVPTFNSARLLPDTLRSLAAQTLRDFEVVISDGGSTDETVALANRYREALPALRIDSRPDRGVYDAMNRGVAAARGRWFLVLGSDDTLHDASTLAVAAETLRGGHDLEMVYGDVRMMSRNANAVEPGARYPGPISLAWLCQDNICQQSVFYRRTLHAELGGFDERYKLYADWDFNIRAMFRGRARWIDLIVADYAATGMSSAQYDMVFLAVKSEMIRAHLLARPNERRFWVEQRCLQVQAYRSLRQRRVREALSFEASYLGLLVKRLPALLTGAR